MSIINRIRAVKCHAKLVTPILSHIRTIGDVSQSSDIRIFDLFHTKKLQRERAALSPNVEKFDYVKEEVGYRLADRLFDIKRDFQCGVDLGGGRGYLTRHILAETCRNIKVYDISPTMLEQAESTPEVNLDKILLDKEFLDLPENSQDFVISSLALHWFNDLPGMFKSINSCLKPDGPFIGAMFGGDTLYELRSSLQLAETERKGGVAPHLSPFTHIRDVGALLNRAGFTMLTIDTDELVVGYPSMLELLHDLKGMAESNASYNRPLTIGRDVLSAASAIYTDMYQRKHPETEEVGVHATFQVIYFIAWKKHESQPKPMERGSATASFKDLGEIMKNKKS